MSKKVEIPRKELETLTKWMSIEKIAERYKCHTVTVQKLMKEYGIKPPQIKERIEEKKEPEHHKSKKNRPFCKTCQYQGKLGADSIPCCDYMFVTGHMRNSDPETCDKYVKGRRQQTNNILYARRK